jgi:bifunctional pyridoxal-dependent enzyme with beta-cystathionase and maltose regulon repressor activities
MCVQVPLLFDEPSQQWVMDYDSMERLVTPRTKMFMLCNPHNPVSRHLTGPRKACFKGLKKACGVQEWAVCVTRVPVGV